MTYTYSIVYILSGPWLWATERFACKILLKLCSEQWKGQQKEVWNLLRSGCLTGRTTVQGRPFSGARLEDEMRAERSNPLIHTPKRNRKQSSPESAAVCLPPRRREGWPSHPLLYLLAPRYQILLEILEDTQHFDLFIHWFNGDNDSGINQTLSLISVTKPKGFVFFFLGFKFC